MIDSGAKFFFRLEGLGGIAGECFVSPAIDTAKREDVPVGLHAKHRKTPCSLTVQEQPEWQYYANAGIKQVKFR